MDAARWKRGKAGGRLVDLHDASVHQKAGSGRRQHDLGKLMDYGPNDAHSAGDCPPSLKKILPL